MKRIMDSRETARMIHGKSRVHETYHQVDAWKIKDDTRATYLRCLSSRPIFSFTLSPRQRNHLTVQSVARKCSLLINLINFG